MYVNDTDGLAVAVIDVLQITHAAIATVSYIQSSQNVMMEG